MDEMDGKHPMFLHAQRQYRNRISHSHSWDGASLHPFNPPMAVRVGGLQPHTPRCVWGPANTHFQHIFDRLAVLVARNNYTVVPGCLADRDFSPPGACSWATSIVLCTTVVRERFGISARARLQHLCTSTQAFLRVHARIHCLSLLQSPPPYLVLILSPGCVVSRKKSTASSLPVVFRRGMDTRGMLCKCMYCMVY